MENWYLLELLGFMERIVVPNFLSIGVRRKINNMDGSGNNQFDLALN